MTTQPITDEHGTVTDEYDDEQLDETAADVENGDEQEQETASAEPADEAPVSSTSSPAAAPAGPRKAEDSTSFDDSDVFIGITLHRVNGHPQGRLVSLCIHNYAETPIVKTYREQELTVTSRLDNLQSAFNSAMQLFFLDLAQRRQKKLAAQAKQRPTPRPAVPSKPTASPVQPPRPAASQPVTNSRPSSPASSTSTQAGKKKEAEKPTSKFQQVSMF